MSKIKLFTFIGLAAVFVILISELFISNLSPYLTVSEVLEKQPYSTNIQVLGKVVDESIYFNTNTGILTFLMTDGEAVLKVRYDGIVNNLGNATEVVAIGEYRNDGLLYAEKILVKCPSKYVESEKGEE